MRSFLFFLLILQSSFSLFPTIKDLAKVFAGVIIVSNPLEDGIRGLSFYRAKTKILNEMKHLVESGEETVNSGDKIDLARLGESYFRSWQIYKFYTLLSSPELFPDNKENRLFKEKLFLVLKRYDDALEGHRLVGIKEVLELFFGKLNSGEQKILRDSWNRVYAEVLNQNQKTFPIKDLLIEDDFDQIPEHERVIMKKVATRLFTSQDVAYFSSLSKQNAKTDPQ